MEKEFTVMIDEAVCTRFDMALQLNGEAKETAVTALLKSYIAQTFSRAAAMYEVSPTVSENEYYGKALRMIPQWAKKPSQVAHKIIRAYLQLAAEGTVTYQALCNRCSNPERYADVYVPTFSSNFAQMKIDAEKSYGKVFEVDGYGIVALWSHIASKVEEYKTAFLCHSTDPGYINGNYQRNLGKSEQKGTDFMQYLYHMRCELCGHEYTANGSDIFLKKCPHCQGGANTGGNERHA